MADAVLSWINASTAIIGCNGIHPVGGVTNVNLPEAEVKRLMVASAQRCVVVADGSKVNTISVAKIADVAQVDVLVTDRSAPHDGVRDLRGQGIEVLEVG